jgi:hypothetical protein
VREFNIVEKTVLRSPLTKKNFKNDRKKKKKKKKKKKRLRRIKANKRRCNSTSTIISSSYHFSNIIVIYNSLTIHVTNKLTIPTNYTATSLNFVTNN